MVDLICGHVCRELYSTHTTSLEACDNQMDLTDAAGEMSAFSRRDAIAIPVMAAIACVTTTFGRADEGGKNMSQGQIPQPLVDNLKEMLQRRFPEGRVVSIETERSVFEYRYREQVIQVHGIDKTGAVSLLSLPVKEPAVDGFNLRLVWRETDGKDREHHCSPWAANESGKCIKPIQYLLISTGAVQFQSRKTLDGNGRQLVDSRINLK